MENKWSRTQGMVPFSINGMQTDDFSNFHTGGGLNLRGYNGYYAIDEDKQGQKYINYKGRSGAALNMEIEFDRWVRLHPKYIRDYVHIDAYLFGDAGMISRGVLQTNNITALQPVKAWSKVRGDAGLGFAFTLKKFGALEKVPPFTVRFDMPLWLSAPPYAQPDAFAFRWLLGVSRAF